MLETIKKSLLGGFVFALSALLIFAVAFAVKSGETFTADMWNNRNTPDYDSGWVAAQTNTANTLVLDHNFGDLPSDYVIFTSSKNDNSWAFATPGNSGWIARSPENMYFTSNQAHIKFHTGDHFIYCDVNHSCPSGEVTSKTGYIRVMLWK